MKDIKKIRATLITELAKVRRIQRQANLAYQAGCFDGGLMRHLDDCECWLADARSALTEFLKGPAT